MTNPEPSARYIMMGGFLGSGKTTSVLKLAEHLHAQGKTVGLITNDQGRGLVDTSFLQAHGFPVQEIAGGCFCCRFHSLKEAADQLTREARPDVFIAEAVGSCTDLVATVSYPLRRLYGDQFVIAPLSVVVDPLRALRIFGLEEGKRFSGKVRYIYKKQLEEADLILINKADLIDEDQTHALCSTLARHYPDATVQVVSARNDTGMDAWFQVVTSKQQSAHRNLAIDYSTYGDGEALLGWLNATIAVHGEEPWDGNAWIKKMADELHRVLKQAQVEVAHLKMTLSPTDHAQDLAVINLVDSAYVAETSMTLSADLNEGELVVNLRAEAAPETLESCLQQALDACQNEAIAVRLEHIECFRPGKPVPVFREKSNSHE